MVIDVDAMQAVNERTELPRATMRCVELGARIESQVRASDSWAHHGSDAFVDSAARHCAAPSACRWQSASSRRCARHPSPLRPSVAAATHACRSVSPVSGVLAARRSQSRREPVARGSRGRAAPRQARRRRSLGVSCGAATAAAGRSARRRRRSVRPTGNCRGASTRREARSAAISTRPPSSAEPASTTRWSLPSASRTRCGVTRPTKPMLPAVLTAKPGHQRTEHEHDAAQSRPHRGRPSPPASRRAPAHSAADPAPRRARSRRSSNTSSQPQRSERVRSPSSQNTMPRRLVSSLMASSRLTSEPAPAATTTPVSSRRVGVQPPGPDASAKTSRHAASAPSSGGAVDDQGRHAQHQRQQGRDRCAPGDAEHVRVGQRVAQQHLQQGARQGEQPTDAKGRQRPRQPQIDDHVARQRSVGVEERPPDFGRRHVRRCRASATTPAEPQMPGQHHENRNEWKFLQIAPGVRRLGKPGARHKASAQHGCFVRTSPMWKNQATHVISTALVPAGHGRLHRQPGLPRQRRHRADAGGPRPVPGRASRWPRLAVSRRAACGATSCPKTRCSANCTRRSGSNAPTSNSWPARATGCVTGCRGNSCVADPSPLCIGQKQRWYLLRMVGDESRLRFDTTGEPEFDAGRWVDYWSPVREVIYFKRAVYARALQELGEHAFAEGPPPRPEWWADARLQQAQRTAALHGDSRYRSRGAGRTRLPTTNPSRPLTSSRANGTPRLVTSAPASRRAPQGVWL